MMSSSLQALEYGISFQARSHQSKEVYRLILDRFILLYLSLWLLSWMLLFSTSCGSIRTLEGLHLFVDCIDLRPSTPARLRTQAVLPIHETCKVKCSIELAFHRLEGNGGQSKLGRIGREWCYVQLEEVASIFHCLHGEAKAMFKGQHHDADDEGRTHRWRRVVWKNTVDYVSVTGAWATITTSRFVLSTGKDL